MRKPVFRVIHLLESIISILATSKVSIFKLVTVAVETGLKLTLSEAPKAGFVTSRPISYVHASFPREKQINGLIRRWYTSLELVEMCKSLLYG